MAQQQAQNTYNSIYFALLCYRKERWRHLGWTQRSGVLMCSPCRVHLPTCRCVLAVLFQAQYTLARQQCLFHALNHSHRSVPLHQQLLGAVLSNMRKHTLENMSSVAVNQSQRSDSCWPPAHAPCCQHCLFNQACVASKAAMYSSHAKFVPPRKVLLYKIVWFALL